MEEQITLRQQAITILYKKFGQKDSIYECADEWCKKQVVTTGIVQYYEAYFLAKELNSVL